MRKLYIPLLVLCLTLFLTACGSTEEKSSPAPQKQTAAAAEQSAESQQGMDKDSKQTKILVAYFSRAGENYQVGYIEKGNTQIIAEEISELTGADLFEIKTVKPYPENYKECTEVAAKERENDARPQLADKVQNFADYDTVFLGYPIWWSDMPMAIYTFLESYDWQGKTVIPFCTSAGDVLTGKEGDIPRYAKGAKMADGLGLTGKRVQESPESVRPEIEDWLKKLGMAHTPLK